LDPNKYRCLQLRCGVFERYYQRWCTGRYHHLDRFIRCAKYVILCMSVSLCHEWHYKCSKFTEYHGEQTPCGWKHRDDEQHQLPPGRLAFRPALGRRLVRRKFRRGFELYEKFNNLVPARRDPPTQSVRNGRHPAREPHGSLAHRRKHVKHNRHVPHPDLCRNDTLQGSSDGRCDGWRESHGRRRRHGRWGCRRASHVAPRWRRFKLVDRWHD